MVPSRLVTHLACRSEGFQDGIKSVAVVSFEVLLQCSHAAGLPLLALHRRVNVIVESLQACGVGK